MAGLRLELRGDRTILLPNEECCGWGGLLDTWLVGEDLRRNSLRRYSIWGEGHQDHERNLTGT
jgi:hypothetical protein